jgi:hypothetical protein
LLQRRPRNFRSRLLQLASTFAITLPPYHSVSSPDSCLPSSSSPSSSPSTSSSWDRQPYQWNPSQPDNLYPAPTSISRNLFISNYHSTWPIDHDDGSNSYYDTNNLLLWGGAKNYLGFAKHGHTNFYVYPDASEPTVSGAANFKTGFSPYCYGSAGSTTIDAPRRDSSVNCTCVAGSPGALYSLDCDPAHIDNGFVPVLINNTYFLDSGAYSFPCAGQHWDLATAQSHGVDTGTVQLPSPSTDALVALATAFANSQLKR